MLAVLAVLLSGPAPALLARATVVRRAPRAALTLWQAVALAAVLSALGATLALSTDRVLDGDVTAVDLLVAEVATVVTAVVAGRLLLVGHRVGTGLRSRRRRLREAAELLAGHDGAAAADGGRPGVLVVDDAGLAAYCLPALLRGRIVVSRGVADSLPPDQLAAVLAHERAHLAARHDLVLEAFTVLHDAFPRNVSSSRALDEARLLVEVLADAAARRRCGAVPLARALVALSGGSPGAPGAALAVGTGPAAGAVLTTRVRLLSTDAPRGLAPLLYAASAAVLSLPTAFVVLPWLASLR